jgi:site-specific DNA-cytosine methylase
LSTVAQSLSILQPGCFTLENVPAYENSESWYLIEAALKGEGYQVTSAVLDAADYLNRREDPIHSVAECGDERR